MISHGLMVFLTGHCESATHLASDARERCLSVTERLKLRLHLRMCSWCTRAAAQVALIAALARVPAKSDAPMPDAARQRIASVLEGLR